uniref:3-oxoacyl-[acyl-carrier protein] reductase n=1 Tax=Sphingomonas sp. JE1 TaxID=1628059 RepID=A0A0D4ZZV9_9SPHN|nr:MULTISPECIES: SDR family NAD(P)-dependent oxidoreductase [unclassified Sphingomonas]AJW29488.1 3-oxoacyl-[acyl-carrier protein] reductase [Sphingomonas sp. JE1]
MTKENSTPAQIALVTGANKGVGLAIAKGLGELGYQVWVGSRDAERGKSAVDALIAESIDARLLVLDVTDPESIKLAAATLAEAVSHLDVLVNNAGIIVSPSDLPSVQSIEDVRTTYETNVFGQILVTQAFLPLLEAADGARVVMMSSGLGSIGLITDPSSIYSTVNLMAYSSSKTALNAVTVAFAKELEPLGIRVNAVEPGNVATDLNGNNGVLTPAEGAVSAIRLATIGKDGPTAGFYGVDGSIQPW